MTKIMSKVLLISEIALLAEELEDVAHTTSNTNIYNKGRSPANGWLFSQMQSQSKPAAKDENYVLDDASWHTSNEGPDILGDDQSVSSAREKQRRKKWTRKFKKSFDKRRTARRIDEATKLGLDKLVDEWEEPETAKQKLQWNDSSIMMILQFKETLNYMDSQHPLSIPFGLADTQKNCHDSSQKVYNRLLARSAESRVLKFETLLPIAIKEDGKYDKEKVKDIKRLFHPRRNGDIPLLEFIKGCDDVYKRIKMFRAKTLNSAQLDDAFEQLIDVLFYFVLMLIALSIFGVDPFSVFISMTGILVPMAFLFNDAGSKYFQVRTSN